ncbi:MAG: hypothetical protein M0003_04150 [Acidithiobacillus sp.]|jgi:hypothetical protein|nr:hypothetical protein [Acidithiobacillus sp.]
MMGYQKDFSGWNRITPQDFVVAYRKAKADGLFENTFPAAIMLAEYEKDLLGSLQSELINMEFSHIAWAASGSSRKG